MLIKQKFCDPHEYDMAPLQTLFQEHGLPSLRLKVDTTIPVGQLRTRVEAFMEMSQLETV
ncbi:MAG: 2-hydroxyacyl-CoA dehydratase family protein [Dehalococcoidia bacterium]|nr:2-hydroxyacyl-CoA dehydratase family protein [Dehalococcoidia bacterium]MDP7239975.1 2-hydroxyacyl-CoA dehydratase family protein [Dehalococcoidia bacterium]MDP7470315.1 2-hydroxyacyl-CoA dehydratase family protein [Dehalococcoidia bacterium]